MVHILKGYSGRNWEGLDQDLFLLPNIKNIINNKKQNNTIKPTTQTKWLSDNVSLISQTVNETQWLKQKGKFFLCWIREETEDINSAIFTWKTSLFQTRRSIWSPRNNNNVKRNQICLCTSWQVLNFKRNMKMKGILYF